MSKPYYESEYAMLTYIKTNSLTLLHWKKSPTSDEYKNIFTTAIKYNKKHRAKFFLADMHNLGILDLEVVKWTMAEIIPEALVAGLEKIAMVFEEDLFLSVLAETISRNISETSVQLKVFEKVEEATDWLISKR